MCAGLTFSSFGAAFCMKALASSAVLISFGSAVFNSSVNSSPLASFSIASYCFKSVIPNDESAFNFRFSTILLTYSSNFCAS